MAVTWHMGTRKRLRQVTLSNVFVNFGTKATIAVVIFWKWLKTNGIAAQGIDIKILT